MKRTNVRIKPEKIHSDKSFNFFAMKLVAEIYLNGNSSRLVPYPSTMTRWPQEPYKFESTSSISF